MIRYLKGICQGGNLKAAIVFASSRLSSSSFSYYLLSLQSPNETPMGITAVLDFQGLLVLRSMAY